MSDLLIGLVCGFGLGVLVMALIAGSAYERGGDDALEALARRRRA